MKVINLSDCNLEDRNLDLLREGLSFSPMAKWSILRSTKIYCMSVFEAGLL